MVRERIYLSEEDKMRLEALSADITWLTDELARAEAIGIDVKDMRAEFDRMVALREGLLREYVKLPESPA